MRLTAWVNFLRGPVARRRLYEVVLLAAALVHGRFCVPSGRRASAPRGYERCGGQVEFGGRGELQVPVDVGRPQVPASDERLPDLMDVGALQHRHGGMAR